MNVCTSSFECKSSVHVRECPQSESSRRGHVAAMAGPSIQEIKSRMTSLSSRGLRQIADEAERIITERVNDGVFD